MKKSKKRIKRRMLFLGFGSFLLIGIILFSMSKNLYQIYINVQEEEFLIKELLKLKEEGENLRTELEKLHDPDYVARYAREKYLYSKDGEFIIRIP